MPFSVGLGHVLYVLTVTNRSHSSCALSAPVAVHLRARHGQSLPTNAQWSPGSRYTVVLSAGQWAQGQARFSPDVTGPGEPLSGPCEPTATTLRLTVGTGHLDAPMDATSVCEHGELWFGRLAAVPPTPACAASALSVTFTRPSGSSADPVEYALSLHNNGRTCHTGSVLGVRLLGAKGVNLPTRVQSGIPSPVVIASHTNELAIATLRTRAGPQEPRRGACEPLASGLRVAPHPGTGNLTVPIRPPLHACHKGLIGLSSLGPSG